MDINFAFDAHATRRLAGVDLPAWHVAQINPCRVRPVYPALCLPSLSKSSEPDPLEAYQLKVMTKN